MINRSLLAHLLAIFAGSSMLSGLAGYVLNHRFHGTFDSKHWSWDVYFDLAGRSIEVHWVFLSFVVVFVIAPFAAAVTLARLAPIRQLQGFWGLFCSSLILCAGILLNVKVATMYLLAGFNTIEPF